MGKTIIPILFAIYLPLFGFSQNKVVPCSNYTQKVNRDSINKIETTFQKTNFYFLKGSCTDSTYQRSNVYNRASFNSTMVVCDTTRRQKPLLK